MSQQALELDPWEHREGVVSRASTERCTRCRSLLTVACAAVNEMCIACCLRTGTPYTAGGAGSRGKYTGAEVDDAGAELPNQRAGRVGMLGAPPKACLTPLGEKLRTIRVNAGKPQGQWAEVLGTSPATVSRAEIGASSDVDPALIDRWLAMEISDAKEREALIAQSGIALGDFREKSGRPMIPTVTESGRRLREIRLAAGLSQAKWGEVIGVTQCTVSAIELGKRMSPDIVARWIKKGEQL